MLTCRDCGRPICPHDADIHDYLPSRLRMPASLGHKTIRQDWQAYREYFCPGCGLLLDVDFEQLGKVRAPAA
jgi:hypothetical protein